MSEDAWLLEYVYSLLAKSSRLRYKTLTSDRAIVAINVLQKLPTCTQQQQPAMMEIWNASGLEIHVRPGHVRMFLFKTVYVLRSS